MPILRGESIVVNAPTASGKTEAIMAPVLERILRDTSVRVCSSEQKSHFTAKGHIDTGSGPSVLLVAPTKALCNDLCRRLEHPIAQIGLTVSVRTGDAPNFNLQKPPFVLITTPESLDSLISRKPAAFLYLKAVILDEIHLVSATGRGDQLQCLIERLRILNKHPIQICASSATVPELKRITCDFLGADAKVVSSDANPRTIKPSFIIIQDDPLGAIAQTADIIAKMLAETNDRKIIVFCNARANVENLVHALREHSPRFASSVFAHHGSLSKEERIRTEQQFLRTRNAVCIATSTLELGIDIGDVNRIVLMGPPPDVASLIQRIGRGSRTQSEVCVTCLANTPFAIQRFLHLVQCARTETLFPDPICFRPNTIIQQALSVCLQNPQKWVGKKALHTRISCTARRIFEEDDCARILDSMVSANLLRKVDHGRYVPDDKAIFLFDRGYMHSMIADRGETDVVDSVTGRTLGTVHLRESNKSAIASGAGLSLTLAGNAHSVSYIRDKKIYVTRSSDAAAPGFLAHEAPRYSLGLARDFAKFMHIHDDALYVRAIPRDLDLENTFEPHTGDLCRKDCAACGDLPLGTEFLIIHFLGTLGSIMLQDFFEAAGSEVKKGSRSPFFMRLLTRPSLKTMPDEKNIAAQLELCIRMHPAVYARQLQTGPWFSIVPEDIAIRWLLDSINIQAYANALANRPIVII